MKPFIKVSCTINTERLIDYKELIARSVNMFLQDSQIVQLECKNLEDQEQMLKELEDRNGSTQFFLADPAGLIFHPNPLKNIDTGSGVPLVFVTVNRELFG